MSALILMMMLGAEPAVCFFPRDNSPGWKQVSLPPEADELAAPEGIDQFRTDAPVEVVEDHAQVFLAGSEYHVGNTSFELTPGSGACQLEVQFKAPLRGAKVDVSAWGNNGTMTLKREERVAGSGLRVSWGDVGVRTIFLVVHDHFREDPVIANWRTVCRVSAARLPVSDAYRLGRSLYYYQPPGPRLPLCQRPDTVLQVRGRNLPGASMPQATTLNRG